MVRRSQDLLGLNGRDQDARDAGAAAAAGYAPDHLLENGGAAAGLGGLRDESRDWMLEGAWGPWAVFPCHRWLSTEVDDCRICRTLFVGHQSPTHTYKVRGCYVCVSLSGAVCAVFCGIQ